jgi:hypothetical protein
MGGHAAPWLQLSVDCWTVIGHTCRCIPIKDRSATRMPTALELGRGSCRWSGDVPEVAAAEIADDVANRNKPHGDLVGQFKVECLLEADIQPEPAEPAQGQILGKQGAARDIRGIDVRDVFDRARRPTEDIVVETAVVRLCASLMILSLLE